MDGSGTGIEGRTKRDVLLPNVQLVDVQTIIWHGFHRSRDGVLSGRGGGKLPKLGAEETGRDPSPPTVALPGAHPPSMGEAEEEALFGGATREVMLVNPLEEDHLLLDGGGGEGPPAAERSGLSPPLGQPPPPYTAGPPPLKKKKCSKRRLPSPLSDGAIILPGIGGPRGVGQDDRAGHDDSARISAGHDGVVAGDRLPPSPPQMLLAGGGKTEEDLLRILAGQEAGGGPEGILSHPGGPSESGPEEYTDHLLSQISCVLPAMSSSQVSSVLSALEPNSATTQTQTSPLDEPRATAPDAAGRKPKKTEPGLGAEAEVGFVKVEPPGPTTKRAPKSGHARRRHKSTQASADDSPPTRVRCRSFMECRAGDAAVWFKCRGCGFLSTESGFLEAHCAVALTAKPRHRPRLRCLACQNVFHSVHSLRVHLSLDHEAHPSDLQGLLSTCLLANKSWRADAKLRNSSGSGKEKLRGNPSQLVVAGSSAEEELRPQQSHRAQQKQNHRLQEEAHRPQQEGQQPQQQRLHPQQGLCHPQQERLQPQQQSHRPQGPEGAQPQQQRLHPEEGHRPHSRQRHRLPDAVRPQHPAAELPHLQAEFPCSLFETVDKLISGQGEEREEEGEREEKSRPDQGSRVAQAETGKTRPRPEAGGSSSQGRRPTVKVEKESALRCDLDGCTVRFVYQENLDYHKQCHSDDSKWKCPECSSLVTTWSNLTIHLWKQHAVDMELHSCEVCPYKTNSWSRLVNVHRLIHGEERPFRCSQCSKAFKNLKQLTNHRSMHKAKERPSDRGLQCQLCGRTFSDLRTLRQHTDIVHEKLRPYLCPICGHAAGSRGSLRIHARMHTGEKPYSCPDCDYTTGDHNSLRRHKMQHTGAKHYNCPFCPYACIQATTYKSHLKNKHPGMDEGLMFSCNFCNFRTVKKENFLAHTSYHATSNNEDSQDTKVLPVSPQEVPEYTTDGFRTKLTALLAAPAQVEGAEMAALSAKSQEPEEEAKVGEEGAFPSEPLDLYKVHS